MVTECLRSARCVPLAVPHAWVTPACPALMAGGSKAAAVWHNQLNAACVSLD